MRLEAALDAIRSRAVPGRARQVAAYMKVDRPYLGVPMPALNTLTGAWRRDQTLDQRLTLASGLWKTDIHEARIAAAKLLTQARIAPDDDAVWALITSWLPDLDAWAIADHAMMAGQHRLRARPERLNEVETWTASAHLWTRRAALVVTLPFCKSTAPDAVEIAARDRILGWAAGYADDKEWFIQKAVAWWVRDLSKRDPARARAFLAEHGARLRPFALREAGKYLR